VVDWKTTGLQIILPIILSGLAIPGLSNIYNTTYNEPNIQIKVLPNDIEKSISSINVVNTGNVAAKNLFLIIEIPKIIVGYSIFNTENVTLNINSTKKESVLGYNSFYLSNKDSNQRILTLYIPRLVPGEGSMIKIVIYSDPKQDNNGYDSYIVYATDEHGSKWTSVFKELTLQDQIYEIYKTYGYLIIITLYPLFYFFLFRKSFFKMIYKKQIKHLTTFIKIIDSEYYTFKHNKEQCLKRLYNIQTEFTGLYKKGKLPEWQYEILNKYIRFYIIHIRDQS
jgi:hypothetical protein